MFQPKEPPPDACYITEKDIVYFLYRGERKEKISHQLKKIPVIAKPEEDGA